MRPRFQLRIPAIAALLLVAACGRTPPPTPSPPTGGGEAITGRERLGWDQQAADAAELATFRYAIYVDGVRSELTDVSCASVAGPSGFACSGRLPALTNGAHTLELAAFLLDASGTLESGRSPALRVTVTALTAPPPVVALPLAAGDVVVTADRVQLRAERLAVDLDEVGDLAVLPDARILAADRAGLVALSASPSRPPVALSGLLADDGAVVSAAVDPEFQQTGHVFVVHAPAGGFRLVRYRLAGGALVDRVPLMRDVAASTDRAAVARFGPDRRLYVAFDDGGSRELADRASEWNGKILRVNPDGGTPEDQPAASPVYWSGLRAPRGLAWTADGTLWFTEARTDRVDRLVALAIESLRPRRAASRASHALPQPFGARTLARHPGGDLPELRGNLLIAAHDAACLLRIRFDTTDPQRIVTSERLLEGRLGPLRAVAPGGDGAIYVASGSELWRLSRHQASQ